MIQITTSIVCLASFMLTAIFCEKHFQKKPPTMTLPFVILGYLLTEFLLLSLVVISFDFVIVLIGGTIAYATFICVYFRHRPARTQSLY